MGIDGRNSRGRLRDSDGYDERFVKFGSRE
jgi:hypothetical protein